MDAAARARAIAEQLRRSRVMQETIRTYGTPPDATRPPAQQDEGPQESIAVDVQPGLVDLDAERLEGIE